MINAGLRLGILPEKIAKGLEKYRPIEKRWELSEIGGFKIINDSYNSNPESLKAAVSTFLSTQSSSRVLVLGDMGELGAKEKFYHQEIGDFLGQFNDFELITVGSLAKYFVSGNISKSKSFKDNSSAAKYIKANVPKGSVILFKASRFMKFEEIIKELE